MQNHKIFKATANNYQELIEIWENSVRATHDFLTEADIQHYKPLILNQYFDQVKLFYLNNDGKIIGFIGIADKLIQMLFIAPEARGIGVGKILVNFAIDNFSVNSVDVNEQNQQAVGFYLHIGFKVIERFEHDDAGKPFPILSMILA
jgi:putative acetyltransferase